MKVSIDRNKLRNENIHVISSISLVIGCTMIDSCAIFTRGGLMLWRHDVSSKRHENI